MGLVIGMGGATLTVAQNTLEVGTTAKYGWFGCYRLHHLRRLTVEATAVRPRTTRTQTMRSRTPVTA